MRASVALCGLLSALALWGANGAPGRLMVEPEDTFDFVAQPTADVFRVENITLGQVSAVDVDASGNVHVFHRGSVQWGYGSFDAAGNYLLKQRGPIREFTHLEVSPRGKVLRQLGANRFYMPHGLTVDHEGNVWVTDVALHQVFKFRAGSDEPDLVLGEAFKTGRDDKHFCQPTDVAVARNGEFFVSDGYCNSRIMKFSADGKLLAQWGQPTTTFPAPAGTFRIPHSLTLVEDWDLICVADRENMRIQCFSAGLQPRALPAGTLIKKAESLGRVFAVTNRQHYLMGVTNSGDPKLFVVDLESGTSQVYEPGLQNPHDIAVADDGTIYVAEIGPNQITRVRL